MDNPETLIFKDDWKPVYNPVHYERPIEEEEFKPKNKEKKTRESKPLLITIQLIVCILALVSLYLLKTFGGDLYTEVYNWYDKNLNNEIIMSETFESFSLDNLINAAEDK
ncbi:MAG: hypothetical protein J1E41_02335 [Ruminococcus sp.]|nr:hypothetical protein [Ruminococcus sp.]